MTPFPIGSGVIFRVNAIFSNLTRQTDDMNAITPTDSTDRFMDLLARHRQLIYKVCYLYATDTEHFKDLCQEVMINM